jgi:hypothetical protein
LPCDVLLGDHPAQFNMQEKYSKLHNGSSNPYIDPAGCLVETEIQEVMFLRYDEREKANRPGSGSSGTARVNSDHSGVYSDHSGVQ